ncbi:MAG: endonuclease [Muribaculaceae bacterium]|nr:endonuclease [Muribaculaceae bacterium]
MRRRAVISAIITGIVCAAAAAQTVPSVLALSGKSGAGLSQAIRREFTPSRLCPDAELTLSLAHPFTGVEIRVEQGVLPPGYTHGEAVPASWWTHGEYADTLTRDLVNWLPLTSDIVTHRRDLPPGRQVESVEYTTPLWSAGVTNIEGIDTELYVPPEAWKGALARIYFHMCVRYPSGFRAPVAYMMFTRNAYPGLTDYAISLLMEWHRQYPPDAREMETDDMKQRLQGSGNPFVSHPELAEYLWGDKQGEPYDAGEDRVALHSIYRLADEWIYLFSPHIPAGAEWYVDGRSVGTAERVSTRQLGVGAHDLMFVKAGRKGRVMIKIEP